MKDALNVAIKVVNFIGAGALNNRLFELTCKDMESQHEALLFTQMYDGYQRGTCLDGFMNYEK